MRTFRVLAASLFLASSATLAAAADANHGGQLAKRWCAGCHVVTPDQPQGSDKVPSFASIASEPGFNPQRLALFLLDPHPKMPDMSLSRREAEDLAAYIASVKH